MKYGDFTLTWVTRPDGAMTATSFTINRTNADLASGTV